MLVFERLATIDQAAPHEADLQATQPEESQQARVPRTHEDARRTQDALPQAEARACSADGGDRGQVASAAEGASERLPRSARITRSAEIRELLVRGKRKRTPELEVFFAPSPASRSRLGLIVPKHGRRIVDRNRLKRRLREIGRRHVLAELVAQRRATDVLIRARPAAYGADFDHLTASVRRAVEALCSDAS